MMGQLAGDSLGGLVEFKSAEQIRRSYPGGVRDLIDGGTWNTLAGQPTDDSEMALALARSLVECKEYDACHARQGYVRWLDSVPFDCGNTTAMGLRGIPNLQSQANGAMMRISPLAIFGAQKDISQVAQWAAEDAQLTHPHPICVQANVLYVVALVTAIKNGGSSEAIYWRVRDWGHEHHFVPALMDVVEAAAFSPPQSYGAQQGWVLIAFQNALFQALHAHNAEEGIVNTVMCGGDTDTNAAIAGALLGAIYGVEAIPERWTDAVRNCRPSSDNPKAAHPRPEEYWPVHALELAEKLLG